MDSKLTAEQQAFLTRVTDELTGRKTDEFREQAKARAAQLKAKLAKRSQ